MDCESTPEVAPPPLYLGFGGGPEPDYPPPTMCVAGSLARVLVFGCAAGVGAGEQQFGVGWWVGFRGWFGGSKVNFKSQGQRRVRRCVMGELV